MYKKIFIFLAVFLFSIASFAQKEIVKFLGIPVDGTKTEMINKLKSKGFVLSKPIPDALVGEFNGEKVLVMVGTYDNKVFRILVMNYDDYSVDEIREKYNDLCKQFKRNPKYFSFERLEEMQIPKDFNIAYETSHKNELSATFYQQLEIDSTIAQKQIDKLIYAKYTKEQVENASEEISKDILMITLDYGYGLLLKKRVWFRIQQMLGTYKIFLYYDNVYNMPDDKD